MQLGNSNSVSRSRPHWTWTAAAWAATALPATAQIGAPQRVVGPSVDAGISRIVDLDGDGRLDVAVFRDRLGWYRNLGNGAFAPALHELASLGGAVAPRLVVADIDGDGHADLFVAGRKAVPNGFGVENWSFSLVANLGGGAFAPPRIVATSSERVEDAVLLDLDGDSVLDLVSTVSGDGTLPDRVDWQRGLGGASFATRTALAAVPEVGSVRGGDFDGDGDLDLVVQSTSGGAVIVRNGGSGVFTLGQSLMAGAVAVVAPTPIDLDGDGDLDVYSAGSEGGTVWFENHSGTFGPARTIGAPGATLWQVFEEDTTVADLDGDGDLDVASTAYDVLFQTQRPCAWYPNLGGGAFGPAQLLRPQSSGALDYGLGAADLDGDGAVDLLSSVFDGSGWFRALGAGAFGQWQPLAPLALADPTVVLAGDLDGDGDVDLASDVLGGGLWLSAGLGGGTFAAPRQVAPPVYGRASLVDVDGDSDLDLVEFNGSVWISANDGFAGFAPRVALVGGLRSHDWADLDRDGDLDLLVVRSVPQGQVALGWLPNLGGGTFGPAILLPSGGDIVIAAAAGDLDGDGALDIVYSAQSRTLKVLGNLGSMSFHLRQTLFLPGALEVLDSLVARDIDGDGSLDVLGGTGGWQTPFLNSGTGLSIVVDTAGAVVRRIGAPVLVDLDGDGTLELLSASPYLGLADLSPPILPGAVRRLRPFDEEFVPEASRVALGDVDGDGFDDVIAVRPIRDLVWFRAERGVAEVLCAPATFNASVRPGQLALEGSTRALDNDVRLVARDLNPGSACALVVSEGFGHAPGYRGSIGVFCLDGVRIGIFNGPGQVQIADGAGVARLRVDLSHPIPLTGLGPVVAGSTLGFQMWYRDSHAGSGSASNFTSALRVTFD